MIVEDLYKSRGITTIEDMDIDNIANCFGIALLKNWAADIRVTSNEVDFIMLQTRDKCSMTESFFHEFAHVLCHGHTHINDSFRKYCESQANRLMYELAVPCFLLKEDLIDYKYIQRNFNVSEEFALKRIDQLKSKYL